MLRKLTFAAFFGGLMFALSSPLFAQDEFPIGAKAPLMEHKLTDVDGESVNLQGFAGRNGIIVIFTCNTCPFVVGRAGKSEGWEGRYNDVVSFARERGISTVLVNSNEAKRKGDDGLDQMKKRAMEAGYKAPYLMDSGHELADAFGARTTPHVFLLNGDCQLVYRGSIDDNVNSAAEVKERYLEDAITKMVAGKKAKPAITKAIGCSIKRMD